MWRSGRVGITKNKESCWITLNGKSFEFACSRLFFGHKNNIPTMLNK